MAATSSKLSRLDCLAKSASLCSWRLPCEQELSARRDLQVDVAIQTCGDFVAANIAEV